MKCNKIGLIGRYQFFLKNNNNIVIIVYCSWLNRIRKERRTPRLNSELWNWRERSEESMLKNNKCPLSAVSEPTRGSCGGTYQFHFSLICCYLLFSVLAYPSSSHSPLCSSKKNQPIMVILFFCFLIVHKLMN